MTDETNPEPDERERHLNEVLFDYMEATQTGCGPDRAKLLAAHPDLRPELQEFFAGHDELERLASPLREVVRAAAPPRQLASNAAHVLATGNSPDALPELGQLGDFQLLREIGRGGMGVVYEAEQISLRRRVALKVLPFTATLDARQRQRFVNEAQAAAGLHHTNIVPVHAVGCERGLHFYAMQLIDGRPLDSVIRELRGDRSEAPVSSSTVDFRAGPTATVAPAASVGNATRGGRGRESYRIAARIAAQVADALEYAHEAGVVHRDVKPANLLLDAKGAVWITDFGLAQVSADVSLTRTGDVLGTLRYMSPEQAAGRHLLIDHRADIYSLGATLYELLTLEPAFPGHDRQTLLHQILNDDPPPPRKLDRAIPPELETIVLKALAKLPTERYSTAGEMAADLRRFLDGRPILARRPSLPDRARKWLRRHPGVIATAVILLVMGVVGLSASTALISRERSRERQRAREAEEQYRLARRAVDEMIQMAQDDLADKPHTEGVRRRMLEAAVVYYQEFVDRQHDDPAAQAELVATQEQVKKILADLAILQGAGQLFQLNHPDVLDDLRISDDQRAKVRDLLAGMDRQRGESFRGFARLSSDQRRQRFIDMARSNDTEVRKILTSAQMKRMAQIALQLQGPSAYRETHVAAELKLTAEQRSRIRAIEEETFFGGPSDRPGRSPEDFRKAHEQKTKAANERIQAILSDDQRQRWQEMTGEPFKGSAPMPPFGPKGPPR